MSRSPSGATLVALVLGCSACEWPAFLGVVPSRNGSTSSGGAGGSAASTSGTGGSSGSTATVGSSTTGSGGGGGGAAAVCNVGENRRCWVECTQQYATGCIHAGLPPLIMGIETCSGGQWGPCATQQTCDAMLVNECTNGSLYPTVVQCTDGSSRQAEYTCFLPLGTCTHSYYANWPMHDCPDDLCLTGDDACTADGSERACVVHCDSPSGMTRTGTQGCVSYCGTNLAWGPCLTNDGCLGSCAASSYWSPTSMVTSSPGPAVLDLYIEDLAQAAALGLRVCKQDGTTFLNDIHVQFQEWVKYNGAILFDGDISAAGIVCSSAVSLSGTNAWNDGEQLGGDFMIVSPASCSSQWGWTCLAQPGACGFCWFGATSIMTRTCH